MSYILDALKKSEQERGHGHTPGIQTVHSSGLNYGREKNTYWPYILISVAILNLIAIVYYMSDKNSHTEIQTIEAENSAINNKAPANSNNTIMPVPATPVPTTPVPAVTINKPPATSISSNNTEAERPMPNPVAAASPAKEKPENTLKAYKPADIQRTVIDYHDLPESTKQALPAIIISAHVYSSNPLQRSIVINNNFMEEGEYFIDGLILDEITTDGAIFSYKNILFHYAVVSGWQ